MKPYPCRAAPTLLASQRLAAMLRCNFQRCVLDRAALKEYSAISAAQGCCEYIALWASYVARRPPLRLMPSDRARIQVFGKIDVECASYIVLKTVVEGIELRRYAACVAVETPCARMDGRDGAFGRLASYIG